VDISAMIELEHQSPAAAHWSRQQYESLFASSDPQFSRPFILVVETSSEMQSEKASSEPGRILAFLVAHRIDQEWELENIVVAEESRRHGIGARLIKELIDLARANDGRRIFLEVRESNYVARALYRKMGFAETGSRVDYYSDPSEDAIVYRLSL